MKVIREKSTAIEDTYFYKFFYKVFKGAPVDEVSRVYWTSKKQLYVSIDKNEHSFLIQYGPYFSMTFHGDIEAVSGLALSSDSIIVTSNTNKGFMSFEIPV